MRLSREINLDNHFKWFPQLFALVMFPATRKQHSELKVAFKIPQLKRYCIAQRE